MTKPTKRKRSGSEVAEERVVVAEVALRRAALAYAKVAGLDPSDSRWRRRWRPLELAAFRLAAALQDRSLEEIVGLLDRESGVEAA